MCNSSHSRKMLVRYKILFLLYHFDRVVQMIVRVSSPRLTKSVVSSSWEMKRYEFLERLLHLLTEKSISKNYVFIVLVPCLKNYENIVFVHTWVSESHNAIAIKVRDMQVIACQKVERFQKNHQKGIEFLKWTNKFAKWCQHSREQPQHFCPTHCLPTCMPGCV